MTKTSDAVYSTIVWAPLLIAITVLVLIMTNGMAQFEAITKGTEYFVPNSATATPELVTPSEQEAALAGG